MQDIHPVESVWRRGWNDAITAWTSWQFLVLEAVAAPVLGWVAGNAMVSLLAVTAGLVGAWIVTTAGAPWGQRNEARAELDRLKKHRLAVWITEESTEPAYIGTAPPLLQWIRLEITSEADAPNSVALITCEVDARKAPGGKLVDYANVIYAQPNDNPQFGLRHRTPIPRALGARETLAGWVLFEMPREVSWKHVGGGAYRQPELTKFRLFVRDAFGQRYEAEPRSEEWKTL